MSKLGEKTISVLSSIVTGDSKKSPYRTGPQLVEFFNQFSDHKDSYGQGFPTRWYYARDKINLHNGKDTLRSIVEATVDPRYFLGTAFSLDEVVSELNQYLEFDSMKLVRAGKFFRLVANGGMKVQTTLFDGDNNVSTILIEQNLQKAERKLQEGDYSGAITNSRSLVETVLLEIEKKIEPTPPAFSGDLIKLYGRVQKSLALDPSRKDISDVVRQMGSGLISLVNGLAGLRNKASDAHGSDFEPSARHARLAVNAAKTICDFVVDEYLEQTPKT